MQAFAGVCLILSCVAGLTLGTRLLWAWRRTRKIPELSIGITALSLSVSGCMLLVSSGVPEGAGRTLAQVLVSNLGLLLLAVSSIALGVGYQQVFRPRERWAIGVCVLGAALLLGWWGLSVASGGSGLRGEPDLRTFLYNAGRFLIHAWGTVEAFRYSARLERRLALGLAEPLDVHRFRLWGVSGAAVVGQILVGVWASYVMHANVLSLPFGLFALSASGLVAALTIWWAFFPPAFYRRLIVSEPGTRAR